MSPLHTYHLFNYHHRCFFAGGLQKKTTGLQGVLLRIENHTSSVFDSVEVNSPGGHRLYRSIPANQLSGYQLFDFIYNYAYIKVFTAGGSFILQPVDYVGEIKQTSGKYTYQLHIITSPSPAQLTLENRKD